MKISIITSTLNCKDTIQKCIRSVRSQIYPYVEHVVIDGGSIDGTLEVLQQNNAYLSKIISEPDFGVYDALNKGVFHSNGDLIGILHSDDEFNDSEVLDKVATIFTQYPNTDIVIGNAVLFLSSNHTKAIRRYSSNNFKLWKMRFGFMPAHTATFIKKSVFEKYGLYSINYISAGDFEFFIRILYLNKLSYVILNNDLVKMRVGGISTSGLKAYWRNSKEINKALKGYGIFSNILLVLIRLPIKIFQQWGFQLMQYIKN